MRTIKHQPRLLCSNFDLLRAAAIDGVGVALLPEHICRPSFISGELVPVLPDWHTQFGTVHAVFASRKGLVPAVRVLIDHLAAEIPKKLSRAPGPG
jgi:DNA-binding transcriptional LysR family regulator